MTLFGTVRRSGLVKQLKHSTLADACLRLVRREDHVRQAGRAEFFRKLLPRFARGDIIFDIGATHGSTTEVFLRLGARVVCVMPDPTRAQELRERFSDEAALVVELACGDPAGTRRVEDDEPGFAAESREEPHALPSLPSFAAALASPRSREAKTCTVEDLMVLFGQPRFIKISAGSDEVSVLRGLDTPIPLIAFEATPGSLGATLECVGLLEDLDAAVRFVCAGDTALLTDWLTPEDFMDWVRGSELSSIDVYARMETNPESDSVSVLSQFMQAAFEQSPYGRR